MVNILHRVGIQAPLKQVYQALATAQGVAGWWTTSTTGQSQVGEKLTFRFMDGDRVRGEFVIKVLELSPEQRVLWEVVSGADEWIGTRISFDLHQDGDYVIVLFRHQGWKEPVEFMHHCSTKWAVFLMSLKSLVETGKGLPSPDDVKIDNWN